MKKAIVFLCLLSAFSFSFAAKVSVEDAKLVSKNFISERYASEGIKVELTDFSLQYTSIDEYGSPLYYRFQIKNEGFIIISATDVVIPILAYSITDNFKEGISSECFVESYSKQIKVAKESKSEVEPKVKEAWAHYLTRDFTPKSSKAVVIEPLVTATWNQGRYFNTYCPYDNKATSSPTNQDADFDNRVPAGCVAIAMSMIMHYYKYPTSGAGSKSYRPENYPTQYQAVNFANQTYNFDAMVDKPDTYTNEIAKLIHHAGVAVEMGYNYNESGAFSEDAWAAMKTNFKYNAQSTYEARAGDWVTKLKAQLDAYHPVYYAATSTAGGHAFVLDGYDDADLFHVNWGWGGSSNGYYAIDNLKPSGMAAFNQSHRAMFNLYPQTYPTFPSGLQRNTASSGTISTGAGDQNYPNNANRSWMIAAPGATKYTFTFKKLDTELDQDIITIYNGPDETSGVAGTFSGNTLPTSALAVTADSVLVKFTSNASVVGKGFVITYKTDQPAQYCAASITSTDQGGSISDLSQGANYRDNSKCIWLIQPRTTTQYQFSFSEFDLKAGDYVEVYDDYYQNYVSKPNLFKRFDQNTLPTLNTIYTLNATKMKVIFVSDNWDSNGGGFTLNWFVSVGIDDMSGLQGVSIYPNPATDYITVDFSTESPDQITVKIMDMAGKLIQTNVIDHMGGPVTQKLPVHDFAKGLYFMQLETSKGKAIHKFVVD